MERTLAIMEARFAIEDIMMRYAEGIDTGDIETVGEIFAKGAMVMPDGSSLKGAKALFEEFSSIIIFYDADVNVVPYKRRECTPRTRHMTSNIIYEFNDAVSEADVRSYITCYQTIGERNEIIFGGRYIDRFARDDEGWHLVTRAIVGENVTDMSHHLKG